MKYHHYWGQEPGEREGVGEGERGSERERGEGREEGKRREREKERERERERGCNIHTHLHVTSVAAQHLLV